LGIISNLMTCQRRPARTRRAEHGMLIRHNWRASSRLDNKSNPPFIPDQLNRNSIYKVYINLSV